jgi:hypothetical protein
VAQGPERTSPPRNRASVVSAVAACIAVVIGVVSFFVSWQANELAHDLRPNPPTRSTTLIGNGNGIFRRPKSTVQGVCGRSYVTLRTDAYRCKWQGEGAPVVFDPCFKAWKVRASGGGDALQCVEDPWKGERDIVIAIQPLPPEKRVEAKTPAHLEPWAIRLRDGTKCYAEAPKTYAANLAVTYTCGPGGTDGFPRIVGRAVPSGKILTANFELRPGVPSTTVEIESVWR